MEGCSISQVLFAVCVAHHALGGNADGIDHHFGEAAVSIGKHCWIGSSVTILKGVTIGDNVVVGAGCVVVKDIPDNVIVRQNTELVIEEIRR